MNRNRKNDKTNNGTADTSLVNLIDVKKLVTNKLNAKEVDVQQLSYSGIFLQTGKTRVNSKIDILKEPGDVIGPKVIKTKLAFYYIDDDGTKREFIVEGSKI